MNSMVKRIIFRIILPIVFIFLCTVDLSIITGIGYNPYPPTAYPSPSPSPRFNITSTGSGFSTYSGPSVVIDLGITHKDSLTIHKPWMCKDGHTGMTETKEYVILSCRGNK